MNLNSIEMLPDNYHMTGRNWEMAFFLSVCILLLAQNIHGQILPPEIPWHGKSEKFIRPADDLWVTPAEKTDLKESPGYDSTINWLQRLTSNSPFLRIIKIGESCQNRPLWLVIASKENVTDGAALKKNGRPTLLFQAGIHSGEIDGKDAGLMFLRDIILNRSSLLDSVNILFIPVLNVDGHERRSVNNRINQRGPLKMGWRTNARNLNLNRDYSKAETPEIKAVLELFNEWPVDLYLDIHVTDGIDYQYDITFGFNRWSGYSPQISEWLEQVLRPEISERLSAYGHIPGPLIFARNQKDLSEGIVDWTASPRFSNGYGDARHLPTLLVENHSLKPYKQRVLGTYVLLNAVATLLAARGQGLQAAAGLDRARRPESIRTGPTTPVGQLTDFPFRGVDYRYYTSAVTGQREIEWTGIARMFYVPLYFLAPSLQIKIPHAYWVPASRQDIIKKLQIHGIKLEIMTKTNTVNVDLYRLVRYKLADETYEGRVLLQIDSVHSESRLRTYAPGSARISTDQPLGLLAVLLLEPYSADSFLQWGYFHEILQHTEYVEDYVIDPLVRQMTAADPALQVQFLAALKDSVFAADPEARKKWFFERSPYYDQEYLLYPVGRED